MSHSSNRYEMLNPGSREASTKDSELGYAHSEHSRDEGPQFLRLASPMERPTPELTSPREQATRESSSVDVPMEGTADAIVPLETSSAGAAPAPSTQGAGALPAPALGKRDFNWKEFREKGLKAFEANAAKRNKRSPQVESAGATIPSAAADLQPEPEPVFNPRDIHNPAKPMRCAVQYSTDTESHIPIGNAFGSESNGLSISLAIDAGRFGPAQVALRFEFEAREHGSKRPMIEATWRPGVIIDDALQIECLSIQRVIYEDPNLELGKKFRNKSVEAKCAPGKEDALFRLMALNFKSNSVKLDPVDEKLFEGLDPDVQNTLRAFFYRQGSFEATIWFLGYPTAAATMEEWGQFLTLFMDLKIPPFWPYYNADYSEPECTLEKITHIKEFQRGMLCKYPTLKLNGKVLRTATGIALEDFERPPQFHNFPKQLTWDEEAELEIFASVPVIRDIQFDAAQVIHLATAHHHVFLKKVAKQHLIGQASQEIQNLTYAFYAFVRMSPNKSKLQESVPLEGMAVRLEWENSDPAWGKPHTEVNDRKNIWFGTVMQDEAGCKATGTDFCVWLNKPRGNKESLRHFQELQKLPSERLPKAWIKVKIDTTGARRELEGAKLLADKTFNPERLNEIRVALMMEPSRMTHTEVNLMTLPNMKPENWHQWKENIEATYSDNPRQFQVLEELEHVTNRLCAYIGPPGAGKTHVLADMVNGAVVAGHKVLVSAVSNKAVDNAANTVWRKMPSNIREDFKFLRLETKSTEKHALLTRQDPEDQDADPDSLPKYKKATDIEDDEAFAQALSKAAADFGENEAQLGKLYAQLMDLEKAVEEQRRLNSRKRSNVPACMTLPTRIFDITVADQIRAKEDYELELQLYRSEPSTETEIAAAEEAGYPPSIIQAMRSEKLTEEEITANVASGKIPSIASRDKSRSYRQKVGEYAQANGALPRNKIKAFEAARQEMIERVLKETDVLLTTCNNSGSDTVKDAFKPTILVIDEAGQVTMAAFAVVVTSYNTWQAIALFGDPCQLLPYVSSGRANEFRQNAQLSILGLLQEKDARIITLDLQYRMAPPIADWPSRYFYKGQLRNHKSTLEDNIFRRIGRGISQELYKIKGPTGQGSETWFVDVVHGVSYVQQNGTSLQNHANADAIADLVDQLQARGMPANKITILTYYTGQKALLLTKIADVAKANNRAWAGEVSYKVSTVESYQGQECEVVIGDFVVAPPATASKNPVDEEAESDSEGSPNSTVVSAFVKNANRLCCLCTRAKFVFVLVGQLTALASTGKQIQKRSAAAVSQLAWDYRARGLVYHDTNHLDSSPQGIHQRSQWDAARLKLALERKQAESQSYLNTKFSAIQKAKLQRDEEPRSKKVIRTETRRTRRPIAIGQISAAADRFDLENSQDGLARLSVKESNITQRQTGFGRGR